MKLPVLILGLFMCAGAAFAEDEATLKLVERRTCADIKAEIETLSDIEFPDEATKESLKQLQVQYRSNCVAKSVGRRTIARAIPLVSQQKAPESTPEAISDALSQYLANKKSNCEKLNSEITKMAAMNDESKSDVLAAMRGVYDMDCAEKSEPKSETSELTVEEWAAAYDANLAAGLCGDGTKPNQYGCCTDETFRDMGNAVFACCPKTGGDCFPPIK